MSMTPGRFSQLRWLQSAVLVLAMIGALVLIGLGLAGMGSNSDIWIVAAGAFVLLLFVVLMTFATLVLKMESTMARQLNALRDLHELMVKQAMQLDAVAENTKISDAAKSLARRDQELEALRTVIRGDIRNERWEAALKLIDEMERRFGYREEAERIREELDDARNDRIRTKLGEAIEMIESHFDSHQWERAQQEMDRLLRMFPDDARVQRLPERLKILKEEHKQSLRRAWDDAVRRNDTDHAIDILKELDQYMTSEEAQALQNSARHVFKEKLLQLGVQFRFAVNEKRWSDALATGLELVRDFPNARMAHEVREVIETLRERARQAAEQERRSPETSTAGTSS
jgi:tetratricopeptide (TPR) repeat protein